MLTKKLKLYGEKEDFKGFIAEIYMNGKELVVESPDEQVKQDILNEVGKWIEHEGGLFFPDAQGNRKPGDPKFLEALWGIFWLRGKFWKKFGDYYIDANKSDLVTLQSSLMDIWKKLSEAFSVLCKKFGINLTIKKLKLYGEKGNFKGFIAELHMDGKKIVIESKDEHVKQELLDEINKHVENDEFFRMDECEETELEHMLVTSKHKPGDPRFLEALRAEFWNYTVEMNKFGHKKFGGYKIKGNKSEIVDKLNFF